MPIVEFRRQFRPESGNRVGIRTKTLGLIASLITLVWAVLLGVAMVFAGSIAGNAERVDAQLAVERADQGLVNDAEPLNVFVSDWAEWDDTYDFIKGTNPDYQRSILTTDDLDAYNVDFIVVTDRAGSIVGSVACEPTTRAKRPVPVGLVSYLATDPLILRQKTIRDQMSGVIGLPEGVAVISASPVTDTNATARINGTIVAGRFLDTVRLVKISRFTLVPMEVFSLNATGLPSEVVAVRSRLDSGESLVLETYGLEQADGYALYRGIDGSPTAIVKATQPRTSIVTARNTMLRFSIALFVLLALLLLIVGVALDRIVLRRLGEFRGELVRVRDGGDASARVKVGGRDEIAEVAEDVNDMLSQIESSQTDLAYLAIHDPLTMLFNRRRFETELSECLSGPRPNGALLWFDLDHFKEVNDSLGHAAGDELLIELAGILVDETRGSSTLARLGGDEFGLLLPDANRDEATAAAARLTDMMGTHVFHVAGHEVRVSASVGIVLYPEHGHTADDLLSRADLAMYHAKNRGRNMAIVYTSDDEWRTEMTERIGLAADIVSALKEDRFLLYAQPSRRVSDGTAGSAELLLRMRGKDGQLVGPEQIIPTAERIGLIRDIDRWVVERAIRMLGDEQSAGRDTRLSVNLSGMAFSDPGLLEIVQTALAATEADPSHLTMEITETAAISDLAHAQHFIRILKDLGCRFALDDFGAGVSSFFYLRHLPVDDLKIDGSLICNLGTAPADAHFLGAIVEMCKGLGINTIAEYVETEKLYNLVAERGVDYAQGFFIGAPMPVEQYLRDLAEDAG